jgi:hypothetical protein
MMMTTRLIKWLKRLLRIERKGSDKPAYRVIKVFERRDFSTLALISTGRQREVAAYRAIPRYPTPQLLEVWIFCEHLYDIPGDSIRPLAGCNHNICILVIPAGASPHRRHCIFTKQLDLEDLVTSKSCAAVFTQMVATTLIWNRHDDVNWDGRVSDCQVKALAQIAMTRRRKRVHI